MIPITGKDVVTTMNMIGRRRTNKRPQAATWSQTTTMASPTGKPAVPTVRVGLNLSMEAVAALNKLTEAWDTSKTQVINRALLEALEREENK